MKITDLALIYIGVILPLIIIVYINVSFTIKAQEQEMYYQQIIDIAAQDASNQMKEVENEDANIDYGYSGSQDQKISVNAQIAVDTFLNNLYNNFDISGNIEAQHYLQLFIPAIAIIDYDGVQISSVETYENATSSSSGTTVKTTEHVLKPKRYYTYTYSIIKTNESGSFGGYKWVEGISSDANTVSHHQIEFTMDDYITHRGTYKVASKFEEYKAESFYVGDENNNAHLIGELTNQALLNDVVNNLKVKRKDIIANTVVKEMTYATNANNSYARAAGITYTFSFPTTTQSELYSSIENIGFMAFVQGISVGNKYLNTKAYGITNLGLTTRYYFTVSNDSSKYKMNLYHKTINCPEYRIAKVNDISPKYSIYKQQAAASRVKCTINGITKEYQGFYPCPICDP